MGRTRMALVQRRDEEGPFIGRLDVPVTEADLTAAMAAVDEERKVAQRAAYLAAFDVGDVAAHRLLALMQEFGYPAVARKTFALRALFGVA